MQSEIWKLILHGAHPPQFQWYSRNWISWRLSRSVETSTHGLNWFYTREIFIFFTSFGKNSYLSIYRTEALCVEIKMCSHSCTSFLNNLPRRSFLQLLRWTKLHFLCKTNQHKMLIIWWDLEYHADDLILRVCPLNWHKLHHDHIRFTFIGSIDRQ